MVTAKDILKGVKTIGIICEDSERLSPVASVLFRRMLIESKKQSVREIQVFHAGFNRGKKISDRALSFLQRKGFSQTDQLNVERINKDWIITKDLILTMDRFIKRDIIYDFPIANKDLNDIVFEITEFVGIDERIRDPKEDYSINIDPMFELIEKCLNEIMKTLSLVN